MNEINETAATAGDTPGLPGNPAPRNSTELLAEVDSFIKEWEERAEDLAFFPSPAGTCSTATGADAKLAVSAGLARAAELIRQFREDDDEAVNYYRDSDLGVDEIQLCARDLLERATACDPTLKDTPGHAELARTLQPPPAEASPSTPADLANEIARLRAGLLELLVTSQVRTATNRLHETPTDPPEGTFAGAT